MGTVLKAALIPCHFLRANLALLAVVIVPSVFAIDFSPQYADSVQDGFPVRRMYFSEGSQRIYLALPKDWRVSGNSQGGVFTPGDIPQATITLENSALNGQVAFDEKGLETYRQAVKALIPTGATEAQIEFERTNEIGINGWTSFEMEVTYHQFGQTFSKSVLFINLDQKRQLRFRVDARKENFEKVYGQARAALGSWYAPPPEFEAALEKRAAKR